MRVWATKGPVQLAVEGQVGGRPPGRLSITGWTHPLSRDSDLRVRLTGVDLVPLQPYFLTPGDSPVAAGRFDLTLQNRIETQRIRAPGQLTLINLRFAPGRGFRQAFLGIPRDAVLRFLETNGRLDVQFVVEGSLDSPEFRLQEALARRVALALADKLGVGVQEIAKGVVELGAGGAEVARKGGEALGRSLRGIVK